jgi:hypothetical protein
MKFSLVRTLFLSATAAIFAAIASQAQSQNPPPAPPQTAPQPSRQSGGQVVFSRSTDESGETATQAGPAANKLPSPPIATDAERESITFTAIDMDVRLHTAEQYIAVRALLTVRNNGKSPLAHIPLQISSSLNW